MLATLAVTALALLAACSQAGRNQGDAISLRVDPATAAAGDTVVLTLRNQSAADTVGYNLCTSSLERRRGSAWEPVRSDRICTMELRLLAPAGQATYTWDLPATLPPGEYRFVNSVGLQPGGERRMLGSNTLRISD